MNNLIFYNIALLFVGAPIIGLTSRNLGYGMAILISVGTTIISLMQNFDAFYDINLYGTLGNFKDYAGIAFKIDSLNSIIAFIACINCFFAILLHSSKEKFNKSLSLLLFNLLGSLGLLISYDLFNIYVFLEISSLSLYGMLVNEKKTKSYISTLQYLIIGSIAGIFYLIGVGLIYANTGGLNIKFVADKIIAYDLYSQVSFKAGIYFIIFACVLKAFLFLPTSTVINSYKYGKENVIFYISGIQSKIFLYLIYKFSSGLFVKELFVNSNLSYAIITLAIILTIISIIKSLNEIDFKAILLYSSVVNISYLILLIVMPNIALYALVIQITFHAFAKPPLLLLANIIENKFGSSNLGRFKEAMQNIYLKGTVIFFILNLIGIPITFGFVSKYYMFYETYSLHQFILLIPIMLGFIGSLIILFKPFTIALLTEANNNSYPFNLDETITFISYIIITFLGTFYLSNLLKIMVN